jgi:hypothetical protein
MNRTKTFEDFLNEKEGKDEGKEQVVKKIDIPEGGAMKEFEIDGKKYKGVISTFQAIGQKQKAMGEDSVGVITLPGQKEVYELFIENKSGEEPKGDKKEEKK